MDAWLQTLTPAESVQADNMLPSGPRWAHLAPDLWRFILLLARGSLRPVCGSEMGPSLHDSRWLEWVAWWRLLAVVSSTSRDLYSAVFGPGSEVLWRFVLLQGANGNGAPSQPSLSLEQQKGLHQMLVCQAPQAMSILITAGDYWQDHSLQAVASRLCSVRDLTPWGSWPEHKTMLVFTALPRQLRALTLTGGALWECRALLELQYLRLRLMAFCAERLHCLALGLPPHLQRLRLELLSLKHSLICFQLHLLSVLPVAALELQLTCCSRDIPKRLTSRLRQLAGVRLAVLELRCLEGCVLTAEHCSLLPQLPVTEHVVVRCSDEARHLQALPSGVVCSSLD